MSESWAAHGGPPPEAFGQGRHSPNTPGLGGYVIAVLVAFAWNALFVGAPMGPLGWLWVFVFSFVFGLPVGVAGALIVHLACMGTPQQWVHVTVAAVAGLVLTWGMVGLLSGDPRVGVGIAISVGVSAGLGRLAVVPGVHRRQGRFASQPPGRVP